MKQRYGKTVRRTACHSDATRASTRTSRRGYGTRLFRWALALAALLIINGCSTDRHLSFLDPQGPIAAAERTHFLWVVGILVVFVAVPIFAFVPWVLWRYRYNATKSRYTPKYKMNTPLEIMTWAGPIVIVIVLSFMTWHYAHDLDPYQPVASDAQAVQIQAIGYDWKWLFIYPELGIASVGMMAIPVNRPVAMHLTSATVMQSLHIPALVSQIYAMGGMDTQLHFMATKPGRSLGMNNMYNGKGFHQQKFTTVAMSPNDFKAWVAKVRRVGMPLNKRSYIPLSLQNTVKELATNLPGATHEGNLYFTEVSPKLFHAVIKETMTDTKAALDVVLASSTGAAASKPAQSPLDEAP